MKKEILVSGLVNIETTVPVRGFPIEYFPIDFTFYGVNSNVSGVGCNISKALTTLGDKVDLVSFTGNDDQAKLVMYDLERAGISTDLINNTLTNTPSSVVLYAPDGRRQIYCDLKNIQEQSLSPQQFGDMLKKSDLAILCNINFNRELIKAARRMKVLTATDVHVLGSIDDDYNKDFMENADILFLSDEKLPCAPEDFIRQLHSRYNNRIIVIGMGSKGALLYESDYESFTHVPAYTNVQVVNTVGAGDALFSSFLHFYIKGYSASDSLRRAVVFAGIKVSHNGASLGFSNESDIEKIMC